VNKALSSPDAELLPLYVDLDHTLVATDVTVESVLLLLARRPTDLPGLIWTGFRRGRAAMKSVLARIGAPDATVLPYRSEVVEWLRHERATGRPLILATASHKSIADAVAAHLDLFDHVIATSDGSNLKSEAKLQAIRTLCREHGWTDYAYAGDSPADLPVWAAAREAIVVTSGLGLVRKVEAKGVPVRHIVVGGARARQTIAALRPHHWLKNLLLFLPLLLAHEVADTSRIGAALMGFITFSLCASAIYIVNDLVDVEADRHHPTKRLRPFAAGQLPLIAGPVLVGLLLIASGALAVTLLPSGFTVVLGIYLGLTTLYSFWLKRLAIIDVIVLAGLYGLRIFAGGEATQVSVSAWMLVFSIFLFTSLAFAKRYSELARLASSNGEATRGRAYVVSDIGLIENIGPTCGILAVLVFALYVNGEDVRLLYADPRPLWLVCPLLLYWVIRLWFLARRGALVEDPLVFAITDRVSLVVGILATVLVVLAA